MAIIRYTTRANNLYHFSTSKLICKFIFAMTFLRSAPQLMITARSQTVSAAVITVYWHNSQFSSIFARQSHLLSVHEGTDYIPLYCITSPITLSHLSALHQSQHSLRVLSLSCGSVSYCGFHLCPERTQHAASKLWLPHELIQRTMRLYATPKQHPTTRFRDSKNHKVGGGGSRSALRMSDGIEHYEIQFVRSEKWRQSNRRGRGRRGNLFTTTVSRKMNRAVMNREWMGGDRIVQVSVYVCVCVYVCVNMWHEMKVWDRLANYTCNLHSEQMYPQCCFQISRCYDPIQSLQKWHTEVLSFFWEGLYGSV